MNYLNIALIILLVCWIVFAFLSKQGILERYNISAFGPILMVRTMRGQKLLTVLAYPRRFWRFFGNVGIPMMVVGMFIMFMVVILTDYVMLQALYANAMPMPDRYNAPQNIFLIPGLNDYIPLVWGAIGLIVTLVVHELAHAVLCRTEGVSVKSMGALLLGIVPIGGFAEPDDEELFGKKEEPDPADARDAGTDSNTGVGYDYAVRQPLETEGGIWNGNRSKTVVEQEGGGRVENENGVSRRARMRILAAGVMANFVVALIAFSLFFGPVLGGIAPVSDVMVVSVDENSVAAQAGIKEDRVITQVDNVTIKTAHDFYVTIATREDLPMTVHTKGADKRDVSTLAGEGATLQTWVTIEEVMSDSAASRANLTKGMTIVRINDTEIDNTTDFIAFLNTTVPGQTVEVFFAGNNSTMVELGSSPDRSCGYLGVGSTTRIKFAGMTIGEYPASGRLHIFKSIPGLMHRIESWLFIFAMPLIELEGGRFGGFDNSVQFYEPVGWAAGYGVLVFWIASALLWIGWINFYAGLFNCLPAIPMDGGHVFKDIIHSLFGRVISDHYAEQLSKSIAVAFAVLILVSFMFMIFGPYMVYGF
ncbi:MAG: peptidase [Candidatus Methanogaster sp.]|uniref:Peptidase n=1 Tax=Candidatus Methanogaster sp. TaxID=3386292 RepID=A0AC61KZG4_9EURY|nr:MAG: peptidase [ANME-2 cluster archaeon]